MKWEILKGSEKDFEGAPEWATKLLGETCVSKKAFAGDLGGVAIGAYKENPCYLWKLNERNIATIIAERRPITEPDVNQQVTTEWSGDGLPPVGVEVEFQLDYDKYFSTGNTPQQGQLVEVVAHKTTSDGNDVAVVYWDENGSGRSGAFVSAAFRPIRSAEDVARGAVGLAVYHAVNWNAEGELASPSRMEDYKKVYDAIAAGKIPGVKLE